MAWSWDGLPVLVTGGSGVVGTAVVRHLVEAGAEVHALARNATAATRVGNLGATPVEGDVLDPASLNRACESQRFVFHVAGVNELCPRRPEVLWSVNVDGTRNLIRAANTAGVARVVFTSSVAALGSPAGRATNEADVSSGPFESVYAETKWASEQVALTESNDVVVVSPASVQGPGRATGTGGLVLDLVEGRLPIMVDTSISIVDIDDCAAGHLGAARAGRAGERYILSGFTMSTRAAVDLLGDLIGKPLSVRFVSPWLAGLVAPVAGTLSRALGGPRTCPEMVRTLAGRHSYDGSRAERELGLRYREPQETMQRFLSWAHDEGLIRLTASP